MGVAKEDDMIRRNIGSDKVTEKRNESKRIFRPPSNTTFSSGRSSSFRTTPRLLIALWVVLILAVVYAVLPSSNGSTLRKPVTDDERCQALTLKDQSELANLEEIDLKGCNLSHLPTEIKYCTNLKKMDISSNPLITTLPTELGACTKLEILFSSQNPGMTALPKILGTMNSITRLGWRSGSLTAIDSESLPPNLVHLILTDNQILQLNDPEIFDRMTKVRKLMLSHNQIQSLSPSGIEKLVNLELLRLAGNQLTSIPDELWSLPKLTWLTISGNPGLALPKLDQRVPTISLENVQAVKGADSYLGAGASGSVAARIWNGRSVAVKTIHGVTSDGRAEDELQMYGAVGPEGMQHHVVGCLAVFRDDDKSGVIMERIPMGTGGHDLEDLALPPTIIEVTTDRWMPNDQREYDFDFIMNALGNAVDALSFLHYTAHVAHGDFYAHNIKVDNLSGNLFLLDLGASWATGPYAKQAEKLEVRAFGILVQELLERQKEGKQRDTKQALSSRLASLAMSCLDADTDKRPAFSEIARELDEIKAGSL